MKWVRSLVELSADHDSTDLACSGPQSIRTAQGKRRNPAKRQAVAAPAGSEGLAWRKASRPANRIHPATLMRLS